MAACPDEANRLFVWMARAVGRLAGTGQPVPVVCGVEGERDLTERRIDTLRGYADSRPVLVGNDAWRQRQLDVPGEIVDAAWLLRDYLVPFRAEVRDLLRTMADQAADTVVRVVGSVRDRTTGPVLTVARAVVYGIIGLFGAIVALVLVTVALVRIVERASQV